MPRETLSPKPLLKRLTLLSTVKTEESGSRDSVTPEPLTLTSSTELTEWTNARRNTPTKKSIKARLMKNTWWPLREEFNPLEVKEPSSFSLTWKVTPIRFKSSPLLSSTRAISIVL